MRITVRFFAVHADQFGAEPKAMEMPKGATVGDVVAEVKERWPKISWPANTMVAKNRAYAGVAEELAEGDEIAVIPPVSGG